MRRIKCKKSEYVTDNKTYNILTLDNTDPYWNEYLNFYPRSSNITRKYKKKTILMYQVRMYKTWKHNRKTQYKPNKIIKYVFFQK